MSNPFVVGPPVRGDDLCGRDVELGRIASALGSGATVGVSGPPGAGLTSLALAVAGRAGARRRPAVRLDLGEAEDGEEAEELLDRALGRSAGRGGRPLYLLLDGLRRDASVDAAERLLRRTADRRAGTLLLGRAARIADLAGRTTGSPGTGRPTLTVRLTPPPAAAWLPYVLERFLETDRWIGNEHVEAVLALTSGEPRPTQAVLHALWDGIDAGGRIADGAVERAAHAAAQREAAGYRRILDGLTGNQRRVLRGLARQPDATPYSGAFVAEQGLASPSSVQRALGALEAQGLVREDGGSGAGAGEDGPPRLSDPLLARWLRERGEAAVDVVGRPGR